MTFKKSVRWLSLPLLAVTLQLAACSKQQKPDEGALGAGAMDENALGDSDSGKAFGLQSINFGYDSFLLDEGAKTKLKANAQIMKDKPSVKIQVEGHCDQRGGIQYNIALGEKRSNSVKKFLAEQGVAKDRISVISFGKEKPVDSAENEQAYAKNRRANFVVTSR